MSNSDCHAISGYAFLYNGGAISWGSKHQELVALLTTEAEYVAATHVAKEALWLQNLLSSILSSPPSPVSLNCNNQSVIALAKDSHFHARTKHIDVCFHFIHWVIEEGKI